MERKVSNIVRIGTGRRCTDNIWYEESDSFETVEEKTDVDSSPESKVKTKKVIKGKKRGRKPKSQKTVTSEPEAGPSGLCQQKEVPAIEKGDSMAANQTSSKPFKVYWGQQFLDTLVPSYEKRKGILKQPGTEIKAKPRTRFSDTTVYYFERTQRRSTDKPVGSSMEPHHFYSSHSPVDVFEEQKEKRQKKDLDDSDGDTDVGDDNKNLKLHLPKNDRDKHTVVHTIEVPIELMEENVSKKKIIRKKTKGCGCNAYCDPNICECSLLGKQCEVFKDNFPCSCQLQFCKNPNGRVAYNCRYVYKYRVLFSGPIPKANAIKCGRVNKRKQVVPIRYRKSYC